MHYFLTNRYGPVNPVKHIKVQRSADGMYYLVDCKMFRGIAVSGCRILILQLGVIANDSLSILNVESVQHQSTASVDVHLRIALFEYAPVMNRIARRARCGDVFNC
jgi:hypothetical protein